MHSLCFVPIPHYTHLGLFFEGIKVTKNILDLKVLESFKLQSKHHQLRDADFVKEPKLRNSAAPLTLRIRKIWENIYFDNK